MVGLRLRWPGPAAAWAAPGEGNAHRAIVIIRVGQHLGALGKRRVHKVKENDWLLLLTANSSWNLVLSLAQRSVTCCMKDFLLTGLERSGSNVR